MCKTRTMDPAVKKRFCLVNKKLQSKKVSRARICGAVVRIAEVSLSQTPMM